MRLQLLKVRSPISQVKQGVGQAGELPFTSCPHCVHACVHEVHAGVVLCLYRTEERPTGYQAVSCPAGVDATRLTSDCRQLQFMSDAYTSNDLLEMDHITCGIFLFRAEAAQGYAARYEAKQRPLPPPEPVETEAAAEWDVTEAAPQSPPLQSSPCNVDLPDRSQGGASEARAEQLTKMVKTPVTEPYSAPTEVSPQSAASLAPLGASPRPHLVLRPPSESQQLQQSAVSPSEPSPGVAAHPASAQSPASSAPQLELELRRHHSRQGAPLGPHTPEYRSSSLPVESMSTQHSGQLSTREVAAAICPHSETRPRRLSFLKQVGRFMSTKAKASSCSGLKHKR